MSFQLTVRFDGPCLYVPNRAQTRFRVLLVNARGPLVDSQGKPFAVHLAAIQFREDQVRGTAPPYLPVDKQNRQLQSVRRGIWVLDRQDLRLDLPGVQEGICFVDRTPNFATEPPGEEESFDLIPRLEDVHPGAGAVAPEFLYGEAPSEDLAARLTFCAGRVFTHQVSKNIDDLVFNWVFVPQGTEVQAAVHRQAGRPLGLGAGICVQVPGSECALIAHHFFTGARQVLRLGPSTDGEDVEIFVRNREPSELFHHRERQPGTRRPIVPVDRDFELLYRLSETRQRIVKPSVPHILREDGPVTAGGPTCGGGTGNPTDP